MRWAPLLAVVLFAPSAAAAPRDPNRCIASAERGQQLRKDGKLVEAAAELRACTASDCPSIVRRDCGRWLEDLEPTIPSVTVRLEDEDGSESREGRVLVDDEAIAADEARARPLDPGAHRFVWERTGGRIEQEVVVREGERGRVVVLRAPARATAKPAAESPSPARTAEPSAVPWLVGGGGAAMIATGAIFWTIGLSQRSDLDATCARDHSCSQGQVDASRSKLVVGDVLVGVGVVAIAAAVYLVLHREPNVSTVARF